MTAWGGRKAQAWTAAVLREYGTVCALQLEGCTHVATTGDHIKPRATHPELAYDVTNGQPACDSCNKRKGARSTAAVLDNRSFFDPALSRRKVTPPVSPPGAEQKTRPRGARS